MANTVNDVMNVIASPDYGIKNIAVTNQEILAILAGAHNSEKNIYNIVDDIKNLLHELVENSNQSKSINVEEKSTKITRKHISNILDETRGIKKSIDNLAAKIAKQGGKNMPTIAKLSDKASQKVADAMAENIKSQKKGGGMSAIIDAFTKLKDISLKDIILGKLKIKRISKIFKNASKELNIKEKDLNAIIKLINAAPQIINALSKVNRKIDKIIKNNVVEKLSDIIIGKNSLLTLSQSLDKNKKLFNKSQKIAKDIKELAQYLNSAMYKLAFAALWSKIAQLGINGLTIMLDNICILSEKLVKNKSIIEKGEKSAKKVTAIVGNLTLSAIYLSAALVPALVGILGAKALVIMTNEIMPIAKILQKNKNTIDKSEKAAKSILVLAGSLSIASIFLAAALVPALLGTLGAKALGLMVDAIIPVTKKLYRSRKHINKAILASIGLLAFTGIMALTSLVLASIAKVGVPALLGSVVLLGIVAVNVFTFKLLGKSLNHIAKGAISMLIMSLSLILFSVALSKIASATKGVTFKQVGVIAALTIVLGGAVALLGIPALFNFILLGSISMAIMSISLTLFGVALGKITKATKGVTFKQVGVIAAATIALGASVALMGIPAVAAFILIGSAALTVMSLALRPYAKTLGIIAKATEKMKMKDILLVAGSMLTLATGISALSIFLIPVGLGALTLAAMNKPLSTFVKTLKIIKEIGTVPKSQIKSVLDGMKQVAKFFKSTGISFKTIWNAADYKKLMVNFSSAVTPFVKLSKIKEIPTTIISQALSAMESIALHFIKNPITNNEVLQAILYNFMMRPFTGAIKQFRKLKKLGVVPMGLVLQTLDAMRVIANHYIENPIEREVIKQARKYKRMMRPFGATIRHLGKLKKLGVVPMGLVLQTLDAMRVIANYYVENPIEREVIKQAKKYKKMMRPFGTTIGYLNSLKKLGTIPMGLVLQTLDAMRVIANYYVENPIEREVIKQSRRYKKMMKPFGTTIRYLNSLKKLGGIPMGLVLQTLDAMRVIANYYVENPISLDIAMQSIRYGLMMVPFGTIIKHFSEIKSIGTVPVNCVRDIVKSLLYISAFYKYVKISDNIEVKSEFTKKIVEHFNTMSKDIQDKFTDVKEIDFNAIDSIIRACNSIIGYYTYTRFLLRRKKVLNMNECVQLFAENSEYVKTAADGFTADKYIRIKLLVKSMRSIIKFLKRDSMNALQRIRANRNLFLLSRMSNVMSSISSINPTNISSLGGALSDALVGVNKVDIERVEAVENMFNAFNKINQSENVIDKFTNSVKEFTTVCKELMHAMDHNTDAISNMETNSNKKKGGSLWNSIKEKVSGFTGIDTTPISEEPVSGVRIANVEELAKTIAEKINGSMYMDIPDTQVQLYINGTGGNEWIITKY